METRDIRELKKTLTEDNSTSLEIRCCYISFGEEAPEVTALETKQIAAMERTELLKYFAMFGKIFGTVGQKVFECSVEDDDAATLLHALAENGLEDGICETFFERMARLYNRVENIAVFLIRGVYDVPVITADNIRNDESDVVYPHIICCICPCKATSPGLSYEPDMKLFSTLDMQHEIKSPLTGFIYPALTDRVPDFSCGMIYSANEKTLSDNLIVNLFGCEEIEPPVKVSRKPVVHVPEEDERPRRELIPDYDETAFTQVVVGGGTIPGGKNGDISQGVNVDGSRDGNGGGIQNGNGERSQSGNAEGSQGEYVDRPQNEYDDRLRGDSSDEPRESTRDENEPSVNQILTGAVTSKKRFTQWESDGSAKLTVPIPGAAKMLAMYEDLGTLEELRELIRRAREMA